MEENIVNTSLNGLVPVPPHSQHQISFPQFHHIADGAVDRMRNTYIELASH